MTNLILVAMLSASALQAKCDAAQDMILDTQYSIDVPNLDAQEMCKYLIRHHEKLDSDQIQACTLLKDCP